MKKKITNVAQHFSEKKGNPSPGGYKGGKALQNVNSLVVLSRPGF
jgi:hypothetical protein